MSKYIDAERLNMEWQTLKPFGVTDTMIENLKWIVDRQPTIEVSEDCISRADLIKQMIDYQNLDTVNTYNAIGAAYCVELAENAPSVVPTQTNAIQHTQSVESVESVEPTTEQSSKVGEWKKKQKKGAMTTQTEYHCSLCGTIMGGQWNYCPSCGAKMKG